ncbi:MAG: GNAT family N-acetyltransferase [Methylophilaceae bacterium]|nr:MAG: GNAT family N-acetyltransferase [Methylophilaceae bacterium]
MQEFYIKPVTWATHEAQLKLIREQVFVLEQHVPYTLEWDGLDVDATHLLAVEQIAKPIGCARLLSSGIIGRMAVLPEKRGLGVGTALLESAIEFYKQQHLNQVTLSAQTQALRFYEKAGFVVSSDTYLDANIPHVDMQLKI